jgi:mRNA-degrading endonuclease RelE of RelBE toxin-antitoxin system
MKKTIKLPEVPVPEVSEVSEIYWCLIPQKAFNRDLNSFSEDTKIKALVQITRLEHSKTFAELGNIKKIQNSDNSYRIKFGRYRIFFDWDKNRTDKNGNKGKVLILTSMIDRKNAYKKK